MVLVISINDREVPISPINLTCLVPHCRCSTTLSVHNLNDQQLRISSGYHFTEKSGWSWTKDSTVNRRAIWHWASPYTFSYAPSLQQQNLFMKV